MPQGDVLAAVARLDLLRVGDALVRLLHEGWLRVQGLDQQVAAEAREPRGQRGVVVIGPDGLAAL